MLEARNRYNETILEIRCRDLRSVYMDFARSLRRSRYLEQVLGSKEKEIRSLKQNRSQLLDGGMDSRRDEQYESVAAEHAIDVIIDSDLELENEVGSCRSSQCSTVCANVDIPTSSLVNELDLFIDCHGLDNEVLSTQLVELGETQQSIISKQKNELQLQLNLVTIEKNRLLDGVNALKNSLEAKTVELSEIKATNELQSKQILELNSKLKSSTDVIESLKSNLVDSDNQRREKELRVEELEEMIMICKSESAETTQHEESNIENFAKFKEKMDDEISSLRKDLEEREDYLARVTYEKDDLDDQLNCQKSLELELRSEMSRLSALLQSYEERYNLSDGEMQQLRDEKKDNLEQIEILNAQLVQLQFELNGSQLSDTLQSQQMPQSLQLRIEISTLQSEKEDLENRLVKSQKEIDDLSARVHNLESQLTESEVKNLSKRKSCDALKMRWSSEKIKMTQTIERAQSELEQEKLNHQNTMEKLKTQESQNNELLSQLLIFEDRNATISGQLQENCQKLNSANQKIKEMNTNIQYLTEQLKKSNANKQNHQLEMNHTSESLARLEIENDAKGQKIMQLEHELFCLSNENSHMQAKITLLENEMKNSLRKHSDLTDALHKQLKSEKEELCTLKEKYLKVSNELREASCRNQAAETQTIESSKVVQENEKTFLHSKYPRTLVNERQTCLTPSSFKSKSDARSTVSTTQLLATPKSPCSVEKQFDGPEMTNCIFVPESPLNECNNPPRSDSSKKTEADIESDDSTLGMTTF